MGGYMKLHTFGDIQKSSQEIESFRILLKYSLHLDLKKSCLSDSSNLKTQDSTLYIENIYSKCHAICRPLFHLNHCFEFFGSRSLSEVNIKSFADLPIISEFWADALKYQCTVSALYTLLHAYLKNTTISSYQLCNHAKGMGYFALIQDQKITVTKNVPQLKKYIKTQQSDTSASNDANFLKLYKLFFNKLSAKEQNTFNSHSYKEFGLLNSDLSYRLFMACKYKECKKFHQFYLENGKKSFSYSDYFETSKKLQSSIYDKNMDEISDPVDHILLMYKTERYYNLNLTNYIVKALVDFTHKNGNFSLDSIPLELLIMPFNLPNVFSRHYFFKFALDSYNNECLEDSIIYKRLLDTGPTFFLGTPTSKSTRLLTWLDLYRKCIMFFSHIIFPIYERCFLLVLADALGEKYVNKAISLLYDYIKAHAEDILHWNAPSFASSLFQDDPWNITQITGSSKRETLAIDLLTQNILLKQNSLIYPVVFPELNQEYLGIVPGNSYHRQLTNLVISSILNK